MQNPEQKGGKGKMKKILIVCRGSREEKTISSELKEDGYDVQLIGVEKHDFNSLDLSRFNLAVISLHPDIAATWNAYLDFRQQFPGFPALVYMGHHGVDRLKSAIKNVLIKKKHC
jgi:DNA-binding NtrC family response regulator